MTFFTGQRCMFFGQVKIGLLMVECRFVQETNICVLTLVFRVAVDAGAGKFSMIARAFPNSLGDNFVAFKTLPGSRATLKIMTFQTLPFCDCLCMAQSQGARH